MLYILPSACKIFSFDPQNTTMTLGEHYSQFTYEKTGSENIMPSLESWLLKEQRVPQSAVVLSNSVAMCST